MRPAIAILDPDAPFRFADQRYAIRYSVLHPDGSGRASLVAFRDGSSGEPIVLSDALPLGDGSYEWDTSALPAGAWALRATIEDARGYSFTAYSRFFLTVGHTQNTPTREEGCSCTASSTSSSTAIVNVFLLILTPRRQRVLRR